MSTSAGEGLPVEACDGKYEDAGGFVPRTGGY